MLEFSVKIMAAAIIVSTALTSYSSPLIIAHRGNSSEAPENTVAAVQSAADLVPQPAYIEIDLHRSSDGVLVVSHDDNTNRCAGVSSMIRENPFSQLRTLDAGYASKWGDRFKGEKFPRLEEVLDVVKDTPIGIMIECKQLLLEDDIIALLRKRNELSKHVIASFDELTVYRAKQIEPAVKTLYLVSEINPTTIWRARDLQADIIGVNLKTPPASISTAQKAGFSVWIWTVDEEKEIKSWAETGANGIITNHPEAAMKFVGKK